jgi:hypothetical protein
MPLIVTKNVINDGVIAAGEFEDQVLTSAGAETYLDNTLLAMDTSTWKLVPYVKGGSTNGNGVVYGVLTKGFSAAGAGDTPVRPMLTGKLVTGKTVIHADGDASNIDNSVKMLCKDQGVLLLDAADLYVADNR